ncbi:MAG: (2Fe-2S)-binding protein [Pygmaiobacter sp.]
MEKIMDRSLDIGEFVPQPDDDIIICRCEEVTKGEIRRAEHDGKRTLTEIRRYLRTGMGLCQGQTCGKLVQSIVARELKISPADLETNTARAPARPIEMGVYAQEIIEEQGDAKK